jgi:2-methylisocitrate lyase-like PEP mutase family enzyme
MNQTEKAQAFRDLHRRQEAFVIPNPWDIGTARLLELLGFAALATTSAGHAYSLGKPDGTCTRQEILDHLQALAGSVSLPVTADLGKGFCDSPRSVEESVTLAAATGIVGCSIEDASGRADDPIYDFALAVERVAAAVAAAKRLPFPFTLTARAENFLCGRRDLDDTIRRLQAYQQAGADVLYAPGLRDKEEIAAVVQSVDRPVNVLATPDMNLSVSALSKLGVRRISVGSALSRAALGAFLRAAEEMQHGTFAFAADAPSHTHLNELFARSAPAPQEKQP